MSEKQSDLAGAAQLEFFKSSGAYLEKKSYDHDCAAKISAALANYVFRFGHVSPQHSSDTELLDLVARERQDVLRTFSTPFKVNVTGVLILLGAAWSMNLTDFKRHIKLLADDGFAQIGTDTPDVERDLPPENTIYMYEITTLQ